MSLAYWYSKFYISTWISLLNSRHLYLAAYMIFLHRCLIGISNLTYPKWNPSFSSQTCFSHSIVHLRKQTTKTNKLHSSGCLLQKVATKFDSCLFFIPYINKSCQPYSHTSTTTAATFACPLVYCNNSFLTCFPASILAPLPSPHSRSF